MGTTLTERIDRLEHRTDALTLELSAVRDEVKALRVEIDPARASLAARAALADELRAEPPVPPVPTIAPPSDPVQPAEMPIAPAPGPTAPPPRPAVAGTSSGGRGPSVERTVNSTAAALEAKITEAIRGVTARMTGTPSGADSTAGQLRTRVGSIDLLGAGGMAVAGGLVTILGIVFFFVFAVNRGWIGPEERVAMGALASLAALGGGIWARKVAGYSQAAHASFGAGVAGGYATLLAATVMYDLLELPLALAAALVIALTATVVAVWWSSEVLAALGLLGALLVPFAPALDVGITPEGVTFAAFVFLGTVAVAVRMHWPVLLGSAAAVFGAHLLTLGAEAQGVELDSALSAHQLWLLLLIPVGGVLLGASAAAWSFSDPTPPARDGLALPLAVGAGAVTLISALQLHRGTATEGVFMLGVAAPALLGALACWRPRRLLALAYGATAVVATGLAAASLLDGASLTVVWALQGAALVVLGGLAREWRMQVPGFGYLGLATAHSLVVEGAPFVLFEEGEHVYLLPGLVAISAAFLAALASELDQLGARVGLDRAETRQVLAGWAALAGLAAVSVALVSADFTWGHVATSLVWAAVGAVGVVVGGRLADGQIVGVGAAVGLLGLFKVVGFDVPALTQSAGVVSSAGAAALVLACGVACAAFNRARSAWATPVAVLAVAGSALLAGIAIAAVVDFTLTDIDRHVLALATAIAGVFYLSLAALTQRREFLRDVSTALWITALPFVVLAELTALERPAWQALVVLGTGAALAVWGATTREPRLLAGSAALVGGVTAVVLGAITPFTRFTTASTHPARDAYVPLACTAAFALLAVVWRRYRRGFVYGGAGLGLYTLSLAVLGLVVWLSRADLETDFQRAHTAVTGVWALVGLGLFVSGLARRVGWPRLAGLAVLGVSLAKLFLYDLAALSSANRAATFLVVGAVLLGGGFLADRLTRDRLATKSDSAGDEDV